MLRRPAGEALPSITIIAVIISDMNIFSGPVTGGAISEPASIVSFDLAANGYVEEEFFAAGVACGHDVQGHAPDDGHWTCVAADDQAPYRTSFALLHLHLRLQA